MKILWTWTVSQEWNSIMIMYKALFLTNVLWKNEKNWCKKQKKRHSKQKGIMQWKHPHDLQKIGEENVPGSNGPKHVQAPHLLTFHLVLIVSDLTHLIDCLIDGLWQHSYLASIRKLIDWNLIHILMNVF